MIQGDLFNLAFVSENSILTILRATPISKAAGQDNLSGCVLKDGVKFFAKPISDLCNPSITSESFWMNAISPWMIQNKQVQN